MKKSKITAPSGVTVQGTDLVLIRGKFVPGSGRPPCFPNKVPPFPEQAPKKAPLLPHFTAKARKSPQYAARAISIGKKSCRAPYICTVEYLFALAVTYLKRQIAANMLSTIKGKGKTVVKLLLIYKSLMRGPGIIYRSLAFFKAFPNAP